MTSSTTPTSTIRMTLPLAAGATCVSQKTSTARSANRIMRLPGRMMDSKIAMGTRIMPVAIFAGWPVSTAESRPM